MEREFTKTAEDLLMEILQAAELNQDDLEAETRQIISECRNFLEGESC